MYGTRQHTAEEAKTTFLGLLLFPPSSSPFSLHPHPLCSFVPSFARRLSFGIASVDYLSENPISSSSSFFSGVFLSVSVVGGKGMGNGEDEGAPRFSVVGERERGTCWVSKKKTEERRGPVPMQ